MRGLGILIAILVAAGAGSYFLFGGTDGGGLSGDQIARGLYLLALLTLVGSGLLGSGIGLGQGVRNLAIWAAIVVALIGGYQYRYELQDLASRLTAGLVPGSPVSVTSRDGKLAVVLDRMGDGHFFVRADVNGALVPMVVDTGATSTVLTAGDARRAGFDPASLNYNQPIATANGVTTAARVRAESLRIGDIERRNTELLVAQDGLLGQSLLGMNFLSSLSGFDVRGDRLTLYD